MANERGPVIVAGAGIGGLAAALALAQRGFRVTVLEQAAEIGEIGAGVQLAPNAFAAFDALGVGERARGRAVYTERLVMMDAVDESLVGEIPTGAAFRARFANPYAVIHRADMHRSLLEGVRAQPGVEVITSTRVARFDDDGRGVAVLDAAGGVHRGARADRLRRRQVGGAGADRRRRGARLRPRRLPRRRRRRRLPGRPALERGRGLGRPELPPRPLSAARRRPVQRRRHLPQPRAGNLERERRQPRGGAVVLRGHRPARAPPARPAEELEALGDRRPRADRELDPRPRDAARRRRASAPAVPGAGRLHGARGRGDARPRPRRDRRRHRRGVRALRAIARRPHRARRPHDARDGPASTTPGASSDWSATSCGKDGTPERFYDALEWLYGWTAESCLAS